MGERSLYCRDDDTAFVDLPDNALNVEEDEQSCFACRLKQEKEKAMEVHLGLGSLMVHGMEYHVYDFIYFIPSHATKLLGIAQIIKIAQSNVIVCLLGRYDEFIAHAKSSSKMNNNLPFDEVNKKECLIKEEADLDVTTAAVVSDR